MTVYASAFIIGKTDASSMAECQDAIWIQDDVLPRKEGDSDSNASCSCIPKREIQLCDDLSARFAVADGVTTAFYSGSWAHLLVTLFGDSKLSIWNPDDFRLWQEEASQRWLDYMNSEDRQLGPTSQNRLNERDPAASTFCGIEISAGESESTANWRARIIGDSCVFHFTKNEWGDAVVNSFPYKSAVDFSRGTKALTSYTVQDAAQFPEAELDQPVLSEGDLLILATDALSEWMLRMHEQEEPVWKTIAEFTEREAFERMVSDARRESDSKRRMNDDDVALIVICVGNEKVGPLKDIWVYEARNLLPAYTPSNGPTEFDKFLESLMAAPAPGTYETQEEEQSSVEAAGDEDNPDSTNDSITDPPDAGEQRVRRSSRLLRRLISTIKLPINLALALQTLLSKIRNYPKAKKKSAAQAEANQ